MQAGIVPEQLQLNQPVGLRSQYVLAGIAPLSNVVRYIDGDYPYQASHGGQGIRKRPLGKL